MGSNTAVEAKHTDSRRATRALEGAGATAHLPADRGPGTLRLPGARRRAVARPWRRVLRQGSGGCPQPWRRSYTCLKVAPYDGCGRISRWADPAEELISEMVIHELAGPGLSDALRRRVGDDSDHDGLVTDLAEDEAAIAQLAADHYSARLISRAEYLAARSALEAKITATRRALGRQHAADALADLPRAEEALRTAWAAGSVDRRRVVLGAVLEGVVVGPALGDGTASTLTASIPSGAYSLSSPASSASHRHSS
jgi:hypothetical protein